MRTITRVVQPDGYVGRSGRSVAMDDQQEPRRASLGLPRFARSGTPPTHVDDAGAGGRPDRRKHAKAEVDRRGASDARHVLRARTRFGTGPGVGER